MINELYMLKDELKKTLLVSHQEEFAHAFPHRYRIQLIAQTSQVHLDE